MAEEHRTSIPSSEGAAGVSAESHGADTILRVVLEGVKRDIETPDSFAIKFSILAKMPLSKVKQMLRSMPLAIWRGKSRSKAEHILALVEEAGGRGTVVTEAASAPKAEPEELSSAPAHCRYCGFPLKPEDARCEFCRTAIAENPKERLHWAAASRHAGIPRARLVAYVCIIAVGVFILLLGR